MESLSLHGRAGGLATESPAQGNCEAEACGPVTVAGSLPWSIVWDLSRVSLPGKPSWCWLAEHLEDTVSEYFQCISTSSTKLNVN